MDRKDFLRKACIAGVCGCGFGALALKAENLKNDIQASRSANGNPDDQDTGNPMTQQWLRSLIDNLDRNIDASELRRIIRMSAGIHYEQLKMDELLSEYIGRLKEFVGFLETDWGWRIDYNEASGVILADENKSYCVCPVLKSSSATDSPAICYCSEGFAELMFSRVAGVEARAEVISSIRRGDKSCIYRISSLRS